MTTALSEAQQANPTPVIAAQPWGVGAQGIALCLCCAYVVSQVYMVPIWTVGPSWSVWPSITDFIVILMLLWLPFISREARVTPTIASLQRCLLLLAGGCVLSYTLSTLDLFGLRTAEAFNDKGPYVGLYQIYRVGQFLTVFWFAARLDLSAQRMVWLRRSIAFTFWVSCALLLSNYFGLIDTPTLAPHIPKDLGVSGPWAFYARGTLPNPVGAISYHHAYPTVQLLILAAAYLSLRPARGVLIPTLILSCLWVCSLVGGSRAGFVSSCLFVIAIVVSRLRQLVVISVVVAVTVVTYFYFSESFAAAFSRAVERQETITTSYDVDGFAGRVEIWNDRVALLNRNPVFWLAGTGFGSAIESGSNGHMLLLQTTLECGLLGTAVFLYCVWKVMLFLWRQGGRGRVLCYVMGALLVSSVTQETFYPVPAFGHFCGMCLFCIASVLSLPVISRSLEA